jgi:hypothetical protein
MIAQTDDPELLEWLAAADRDGGGFVSSVARAALVADQENYCLIRPVVIALRAKYTRYEPSAQVKAEIAARPSIQELYQLGMDAAKDGLL